MRAGEPNLFGMTVIARGPTSTTDVFGQKLNALLIQGKGMPEHAHMSHACHSFGEFWFLKDAN